MYGVVAQSYSVTEMPEGTAMLLIGIFAILLAAAVSFRNPAAVIAWSFSVLLLIFSGLFGMGFEIVWFGIMLTVVLITIGVVVRWTS
jgi:hypothetical protein